MSDDVKCEIRNKVLHIEFNRPEKKNAITIAMSQKMADALSIEGALCRPRPRSRICVFGIVAPAHRLSANLPSPGAMRATKLLLKTPMAPAVADAISREGKEFGSRLGSAEASEAFSAFMGRRPADF